MSTLKRKAASTLKKIFLPEIENLLVKEIQIQSDIQELKLLVGNSLAREVKAHGVYENIHDAEFKVFSQAGDDGILQYLIAQAQPQNHKFIEFGVQEYKEANTRFLLMNDNWQGLILDDNQEYMNSLRHTDIYWRFDLNALSAFVTRENINQIFLQNGFNGEIGLLSIDIDGNDYWIWECIEAVNPVIVVAEYNSVFGPDFAISIPYDPMFVRTRAHYSNLYWGCSLKALCLLAEQKNYAFVGSNSAGSNAYFVRRDKLGKIPALTCAQGYVESRVRESRDPSGNLTYLAGSSRLSMIKDKEVYDIEKRTVVRLGDLLRD